MNTKPHGIGVIPSRRLLPPSKWLPLNRWGPLTILLLLCQSIFAVTVNWNNPAGGQWTVATNWNPAKVPTASDDAVITLPGSYVVTLDQNATVASITLGGPTGEQTLDVLGGTLTIDQTSTIRSNGQLLLSGGIIAGTGVLRIEGRASWTAGNWLGVGEIGTEGSMVIAGTADKRLGGELRNEGLLTWEGTHTLYFANGRINNLSRGLFEIRNNQRCAIYNGSPVITNNGTIRKLAGEGATAFEIPILNSGTIEVASGTISYANGSRFSTGTVLSGAGKNLLVLGSFTFDGMIESENLELGGGILLGTNTFTGTVFWTAGWIGEDARVTIGTGTLLRIENATSISLLGELVNEGTISWLGTNHIYLANGRLNNLAGGILDIRNNQSFAYYNGSPVIQNSGVIRKSEATGVTIFEVPLINHAELQAEQGTMAYGSGSLFRSGTVLSGAGTNLVNVGTVTFDGTITSENLDLGGATVIGTNTFVGTTRWTSGRIGEYAKVWVATNGVLHLDPSVDLLLAGELSNEGLIAWSGVKNVYLANGQLVNRERGIMEIQNDQNILIYNGLPRVHNFGRIRKTSPGVTRFEVPITNAGMLDAQSGIIQYGNSSLFQTGTAFTGNGTNALPFNQVTLAGNISSENLEFAGATILGTNSLAGTVRWTAGWIGEGAQVSVATNGILRLNPSVDLGLAGELRNEGLIAWSGDRNVYLANGQLVNLERGIMEMQNDQNILIYNGLPRVHNFGKIRKTNSTGATLIEVPMRNAGVLEAASGIINYGTGGIFGTGTAFIGTGTNALPLGAVTLDGTILSENLNLAGATILGTNTITGSARWSAGTIEQYAVMTIDRNGVLQITGPQNVTLQGALNNEGLITWTGENNFYFALSAVVNNKPSGVFDVRNNQVFAFYNGVVAFKNAGRLQKSAGTGATVFEAPVKFSNTGIVQADSGTITFGSYSGTNGTLSVGLRSLTEFGKIHFAAPAIIEGTLGVKLLGYQPRAGDAFALITYPSHSGSFSAFELPAEGAWQTNETIYGATAITLTVLNSRPTLQPITDKTVAENTTLTFTAVAADADPGQTRTFALVGAPSGASINPATGVFMWTPTEGQGPTTNMFRVEAKDNGEPQLSHVQDVTVNVTEVNLAPTLASISDQKVIAGETLSITPSAADDDLPANTEFTLVEGPIDVLFNSVSGKIEWIPEMALAWSTIPFTLKVSDNGLPVLNASQSFSVTVLPPPTINLKSTGIGTISLSWPAVYDDFVLQSATSLPSIWAGTTNEPALVGTNYVVPITFQSAGEYFRLRKP